MKLIIRAFQEPVCLKKEVLGFAVNRLQFALLAEAWRLVSDDVLSPSDVDKVWTEDVDGRRFCGLFYLFEEQESYTHKIIILCASFNLNDLVRLINFLNLGDVRRSRSSICVQRAVRDDPHEREWGDGLLRSLHGRRQEGVG